MILLDDSMGAWMVAESRAELLGALLDLLADEPEIWQLTKIAAACLGHQEDLAIVVTES